MSRKAGWITLAALVTAGVLLGLWRWSAGRPGGAGGSGAPPSVRVVGSAACASCHPQQYDAWLGSNHRHAMAPATPQAVLGDFGDVEFEYFGRTTRFFRDGDTFRVTTDDQQGQPATFTVAYTLGYHPLQQYLVDMGQGRIQALPFAWDTRRPEDGGGRWFHLYPDEHVAPDNPLFWTRPLQNWNHMCGECHTTAFAKGFDRATGSFTSTWSEIGNGCESCHGAGGRHVEARRTGRAAESPDASMRRLASLPEQIDQCGFCHARRVRLRDPEPPPGLHETMLDTWRPQLPQEDLYFADGQIRDEVFEIGSFLQSRMASKGIRCSDCHDPHTARVRAEGNALCTQCHVPERFDVRSHHLHDPSSRGAQCVSCHMPVRTYMVVDDRHDHRLGVPAPHLSDQLGTPNPCVSCHKDRSNAWAAGVLDRQRQATGGTSRTEPSLGEIASAQAREQTGAPDLLRRLLQDPSLAPIARAAALAQARTAAPLRDVIAQGLASPDALVRVGAVQAAGRLPPSEQLPLLFALLRDPSRAVRHDVAILLSGVADGRLPPDAAATLRAGLAETRQWLAGDADRAEALAALAHLQAGAGDVNGARATYEEALQRDELSLVTLLNYADFNRARGDDAATDSLLTRAVTAYPDAAAVHFALGLLRVRQQRHAEAVPALARAVQLAPHDSGYAYVHGVALYSTGQTDPAMRALAEARRQFPANEQIRSAVDAYCSELRQKGTVFTPGGAVDEACAAAPPASR